MTKRTVYFLTGNPKKAQDFNQFGLGVRNFTHDIPEVLSEDVETVVLYKARDSKENDIVVDDTALYIEGSHFWGTQIKHVYDEIKEDTSYHDKKAVWKVSFCMRQDDNFYIATGITEGKLMYPGVEYGYHFERIFAIEKDGEWIHFASLNEEDKVKYSPRFQALRMISSVLEGKPNQDIQIVPAQIVQEWTGDYQIETTKENNVKLKARL